MSLIEWTDQFSVGVASMDAEHRTLVALFNQLYEALKRGRGAEEVTSVLKSLLMYTERHFASEEAYMRSVGFPDYDAHKAEHDCLSDRVREYAARASDGSLTVQTEVMFFLRNWLVQHIQRMDREYGLYAARQQAKIPISC